jgi:hypothetical protein
MPPAMFTSLTPSAKTSFVIGQVSNSFGLATWFRTGAPLPER